MFSLKVYLSFPGHIFFSQIFLMIFLAQDSFFFDKKLAPEVNIWTVKVSIVSCLRGGQFVFIFP